MFNPDNPNLNDDQIITKLILMGCLEVCGVDSKTGSLLYNITPKMKKVMPEFYNEHINYVNAEIMNLWSKGFINLTLLDSDPIITITPKAIDQVEISKLSNEEIWSLEEIKRNLKAKKPLR